MQALYSRLTDFIDSLSTYPPKEHPAIQVGDIFNALLDATKQRYPDDPVVATITPAKRLGVSEKSNIDAGSLIAAAQQLRAAAEDDRPAPVLVA